MDHYTHLIDVRIKLKCRDFFIQTFVIPRSKRVTVYRLRGEFSTAPHRGHKVRGNLFSRTLTNNGYCHRNEGANDDGDDDRYQSVPEERHPVEGKYVILVNAGAIGVWCS